jgi:hypothetical protein
MHKEIQLFAAVFSSVIGLSHVFQPRAWVEFFIWLREKGRPGVLVNGFLTLGFGSFIVGFHNVWGGLPIILTLLGWSQVLKGFVNFVFPQLALKGLGKVSIERAWHFIVAGMFTLVFSTVMWYVVLTR